MSRYSIFCMRSIFGGGVRGLLGHASALDAIFQPLPKNFEVVWLLRHVGATSTCQPLQPLRLVVEEIYAFQSQASETWWWPRWTSMLQSPPTVINLGWVVATAQDFNENSWNRGLTGLQMKFPLHRQWLGSMWLSPKQRWQQVHWFFTWYNYTVYIDSGTRAFIKINIWQINHQNRRKCFNIYNLAAGTFTFWKT